MKNQTMSRLRRPLNPMPPDVSAALAAAGLRAAYDARPDYQRNDYIGWINRAVRPATRQKRLHQMLQELRDGNLYMAMVWRGR